jgi:Flp pilus assembly protein TadD
MEAFLKATRLQPDLVKAHSNLGLAYLNLRRWQDAADSLKKAAALKPDDPQAHFGLCAYYLQMGDRESLAKELQLLQKLDLKLAQKIKDMLPK